ncbi:DUF3995 domain-containing protein [soil metagenome]
MPILILINTGIFLFLSLLHFHWAFGGRWSWGAAVPSKPDGKLLFNPGMTSSLVVAFGLLLFAFIMLGNSGLWDGVVARRYFQYGGWVISAIFLLRAIGDFRFIGFTKRVKGTPFAINDTRMYSPLCLIISGISIAVSF